MALCCFTENGMRRKNNYNCWWTNLDGVPEYWKKNEIIWCELNNQYWERKNNMEIKNAVLFKQRTNLAIICGINFCVEKNFSRMKKTTICSFSHRSNKFLCSWDKKKTFNIKWQRSKSNSNALFEQVPNNRKDILIFCNWIENITSFCR